MMAAAPECPHCGGPLTPPPPVDLGDVTIDRAVKRIIWRGRTLRLAPTLYSIVDQLVAARGRLVASWALMRNAGYRGDDPAGNLKVHLWRLRKIAPDLPIYVDADIGCAWRVETNQ
ncbi:hypothetical protein [Sphingomonas sp. MM-1]|uniref:hypothetical protein n=1 Tax=Sphingomonas sp. MM-1 TaxID=745310 RepID=UPI000B1FD136|nr:hypothetical protein [Sphingomonas sp. MM-1]